MRKYQQLLLLVVSCLSLIILFIYKSENARLKYVLQVVNFFGRKDVTFCNEFENSTLDNGYFNYPLPAWQALDNSFFAYAAYWLDGKERTALADVVSVRNANVVFSCYIQFEDGSKKIGKFRFQPWGHKSDAGSNFENYIFFCQLLSTIKIKSQAESVTFVSLSTDKISSGIPLHLRMLKTLNTEIVIPPVVCLDLTAAIANHNQRVFLKNDKYIMQFFLHHKTIGIKHFLIYNSNALPMRFFNTLKKTLTQYYLLPFNFPFHINNVTATHVKKIIQLDCARRSAVISNYTVVLTANEFLYAKSSLASNDTIINSTPITNNFSFNSNFHVTTIDVCLDAQKPLLMDNNLYDGTHPEDKTTVIYSMSRTDLNKKDVKLPANDAFVHTYVECQHIGEDGLSDWRHRLRADFSNFLLNERNEMNMFFR